VTSLPGRSEGRFGRPGDPLNLLFVASARALDAALTSAGWTRVPGGILASVAAGLRELARGRRLAAFPPMNVYALGGRPPDRQWSRPVRGISERHHFRLWALDPADELGRLLWWGCGNYDLRVRWRDLSHAPDPDADRERDFIAASLADSPLLESAALEPLPQIPREGVNDKGYPFRGDGRAAKIVLRPDAACFSAPGPAAAGRRPEPTGS
jgi:LssY C-terminus